MRELWDIAVHHLDLARARAGASRRSYARARPAGDLLVEADWDDGLRLRYRQGVAAPVFHHVEWLACERGGLAVSGHRVELVAAGPAAAPAAQRGALGRRAPAARPPARTATRTAGRRSRPRQRGDGRGRRGRGALALRLGREVALSEIEPRTRGGRAMVERVAIVGFDGTDVAIVQRGIDEGWMPSMAALAREGRFAPLVGRQDVLTSTSGPTLVRAHQVEDHQLLNSTQLVPGSYRLTDVDETDRHRPALLGAPRPRRPARARSSRCTARRSCPGCAARR